MGIRHSRTPPQDCPLFLDGSVPHKGLLFLSAGTKLMTVFMLCMNLYHRDNFQGRIMHLDEKKGKRYLT